jgi:hypothetical protein
MAVMVAFLDRAIEPLEGGVSFPEAEVHVPEGRGKDVTFRAMDLLQHAARFVFFPHLQG